MARKRKLDDRSARHDAAYRRAKQEGFAARAVYKLQELDQRFSLLGHGRRVLDLGCWPGSWMQHAAQRVGEEGLVIGLDLRPVELALPPWCEAFVVDVDELDPARRELLYELDTARRSLFDKHGRTPEFDTLAKTFHNLLRMWAEV